MLSRYTFYRRILQKNLLENSCFCDVVENPKTGISELRNFLRRSPFGRPIPVSGPAAVGEALRYYVFLQADVLDTWGTILVGVCDMFRHMLKCHVSDCL